MTATLTAPPAAQHAAADRPAAAAPSLKGSAATRVRTHPAPARPRQPSTGRRTPAGAVVERPPLVGAQARTRWDRIRFQPTLDPAEARTGRKSGETPTRPPAPAPVEMPDPLHSAATIVTAAGEVLTGHRPVDQLARWTTPELFEAIARRAGLARRLLGPDPQPDRMRARTVRTQQTAYGACEATVLLDDGSRVRAAAARLEAHRGRWILSRLEIA